MQFKYCNQTFWPWKLHLGYQFPPLKLHRAVTKRTLTAAGTIQMTLISNTCHISTEYGYKTVPNTNQSFYPNCSVVVGVVFFILFYFLQRLHLSWRGSNVRTTQSKDSSVGAKLLFSASTNNLTAFLFFFLSFFSWITHPSANPVSVPSA